MGTDNARQAAPIPSTARANCHMTAGRSGLPKFKQLVAPSGRAPAQATFRHASATASIAPRYGSRKQYRLLPSTDIASPRLVPLIRRTPAPNPGKLTVLV